MKLTITSGFVVLIAGLTSAGAADSPHPKYGPQATRLFDSTEYVRKNPAPDFWALTPYYVPQQDGSSCGVASVSMVSNAARASSHLSAADALVTQKGLTKLIGKRPKGITLDELGPVVLKSLMAIGFSNATVSVVHAEAGDQGKKKLHEALVENEKSAKDFILTNFLQSELTGDPEGAVGHIAPLAAYDEKTSRALIMDPDREYYEPYWVSEETLLKAMSTVDKTSGKTRGYIQIRMSP